MIDCSQANGVDEKEEINQDTKVKDVHGKSSKEKRNKKLEYNINQLLKSLNHLESNDKLARELAKRLIEASDLNHKLEAQAKEQARTLASLDKEKEQAEGKLGKAVLARITLENLCRELQKQNKAIKEESVKVQEEEERKRQMANKFQTSLEEISHMIRESDAKNLKLKEENDDMHKKLQSLVSHYEKREKNVENILKRRDKEVDIIKAQCAELKSLVAEEKETFLKEKQKLLLELAKYQERISSMQAVEIQLRSQLSRFSVKYDEFQKIFAENNGGFVKFKSEMQQVVKKHENESKKWKLKFSNSEKSLVEACMQKKQQDDQISLLNKKVSKLEDLCRALQQERNSLAEKLKGSKENVEDIFTMMNVTRAGLCDIVNPGKTQDVNACACKTGSTGISESQLSEESSHNELNESISDEVDDPETSSSPASDQDVAQSQLPT